MLTEYTLFTSEVVWAEWRDVLSRKVAYPPSRSKLLGGFCGSTRGPHPSPDPRAGPGGWRRRMGAGQCRARQGRLFVTGDQGVLVCIKPPLQLVNPWRCWGNCAGLLKAAFARELVIIASHGKAQVKFVLRCCRCSMPSH